jgi:hypothetical protein
MRIVPLVGIAVVFLGIAARSMSATQKRQPRDANAVDFMKGRARDAGEFKPRDGRCQSGDQGTPVILSVAERRPGEWGGCCIEQVTAVPLSRDARPRVELTLDLDDQVDVKFEAGPFGHPTATGWLHKGFMSSGKHSLSKPLVDDGQNLLSSGLQVTRLCVALVGTKGPAPNKLTILGATSK